MDEILTPSEIQILQKNNQRRASRKCYRCRQKKMQCSYEFPKCNNCASAELDCYAWLRGIKKPVPRSLPLYLENKIAQLEIELEQLKKHHLINDTDEQSYSITKYSANTILENVDNEDELSFFYFNSSSLPAPFDTMIDNNKRGSMKSFVEKHPPIDLKTIPKKAIKIMMESYMDLHSPQYPIISRPLLKDMLDRLLDDPDSLSSFEKPAVSIILAMSAALITNKSEKHALSSSSALFSTALLQILETTWKSKMKKLQITLLVTHYAFVNPCAADVWHALRDSFNLCIGMGLHKNVETDMISVLQADDRRRLFLVCSAMLRHLSSVLKIKFPIPQSLISAQYPTVIDDSFITEKGIDYSGPQTKAAALHIYTLRLCDSEVCDVLWYNKKIPGSIEEWIDDMEKRVERWFIKSEEFAKVNQLRFRFICKASMQTRLRRRTPRIPNPTRASFVKLVNAVSVHIDEYLRDAQMGQVSYLFMGVYYIEEAASILLDVMWFESEWIQEFFTTEFLDSKLQGCIKLLKQFNERWPDIGASNMFGHLEDLREKVVARLKGSTVFDNESILKISSQIKYLIFPQEGKASTAPFLSMVSDESTEDHQIIKNLEEGFLLNGFVFPDKSTWQDHFVDENVWDLPEFHYIGDYI